MAGRNHLTVMLSTADYKDVKALKSCFTEFVHIHGAAFFSIQRGCVPKGRILFTFVRGRDAKPAWSRRAFFLTGKRLPLRPI